MEHLFDFGIAQEDALTENKVLDLKPSDRLLCITSAGEVPLNLLAFNDIKITSVDISANQNALLRLKLNAALFLEPMEAAGFLGYMKMNGDLRLKLYKQISGFLIENDRIFWSRNIKSIRNGCINVARFETYIRKFNSIALTIIGKKKLLQLFEIENIEEQKLYFDNKMKTPVLKKLFNLAFHPKLYKNRGISSQGFVNSNENVIAEFFFNRFRDFCCSTPARKNYFLQFTFFNRILFPEALPEFLSESGTKNLKRYHKNLNIQSNSIFSVLENCSVNEYNKFHISNIGDWVSKKEFSDLLHLINDKSDLGGRISSRYIHYLHPLSEELQTKVIPDFQLGNELIKTDRYPFYNIVPFSIRKTAGD